MIIQLSPLHPGMHRQVVEQVLSFSVYSLGGGIWRWRISFGGEAVACGPATSLEDGYERVQAAADGLEAELQASLVRWREAQKGGAA